MIGILKKKNSDVKPAPAAATAPIPAQSAEKMQPLPKEAQSSRAGDSFDERAPEPPILPEDYFDDDLPPPPFMKDAPADAGAKRAPFAEPPPADAQAAKRAFMAPIAQDIRSPVKGPVFVSLDKYHEVKQMLHDLKQASAELRYIISQLKQNRDGGTELLQQSVERLSTIEARVEDIGVTLRTG